MDDRETRAVVAQALRDAEGHIIGWAKLWAARDRKTPRRNRASSLERAVATYERIALAIEGSAVTIEPLDVRCSSCRAALADPCRGPHYGDVDRRDDRGFIDWSGWHLNEPHPERRERAGLLMAFSRRRSPQ